VNFGFVFRQLGLLILVLSAFLLFTAVWAFGEWQFGGGGNEERSALLASLLATGVAGLVGGILTLLARGTRQFLGRREALLLVSLSWIVGMIISALPWFIWAHLREPVPGQDPQPFADFVNCCFESMSGLTTTGATILSKIGQIPRSLLLWRSVTHWIGGLGIVVLFVAVLPSLGAGGKRLFEMEATGPTTEGVRPRIRETARILWLIYCVLSSATFLAYWLLTPLDWFAALNHTLSTVSTGGFSLRDESIAAYDSLSLEVLVTLAMLLSGVNFAVFYQMWRGRWRAVFRDVELRVYLVLKLVSIVVIAISLMGEQIVTTAGSIVEDAGFGDALRAASFTLVSLHTGTGFCTADYDRFPELANALLWGLVFVGGCAGSTAGGVKVVRFWIALKVILAEIEKAFRPTVVRSLKMGGGAIDDAIKFDSISFCLLFLLLCMVGTGAILVFEPDPQRCDFLTAMTASLTAAANCGPGLHGIGSTQNWGWMTAGSKIVAIALMALGRLEIYALAALFTVRFWRAR